MNQTNLHVKCIAPLRAGPGPSSLEIFIDLSTVIVQTFRVVIPVIDHTTEKHEKLSVPVSRTLAQSSSLTASGKIRNIPLPAFDFLKTEWIFNQFGKRMNLIVN